MTTTTIAKLDANRVYWGIETIELVDLTDEQVEVPPDCDLTPGKYRWSVELQKFDSLTDMQQAPSGVPSLEAAVFELVQWAQTQGAKSAFLDAYAAAFKISIDAIGAEK